MTTSMRITGLVGALGASAALATWEWHRNQELEFAALSPEVRETISVLDHVSYGTQDTTVPRYQAKSIIVSDFYERNKTDLSYGDIYAIAKHCYEKCDTQKMLIDYAHRHPDLRGRPLESLSDLCAGTFEPGFLGTWIYNAKTAVKCQSQVLWAHADRFDEDYYVVVPAIQDDDPSFTMTPTQAIAWSVLAIQGGLVVGYGLRALKASAESANGKLMTEITERLKNVRYKPNDPATTKNLLAVTERILALNDSSERRAGIESLIQTLGAMRDRLRALAVAKQTARAYLNCNDADYRNDIGEVLVRIFNLGLLSTEDWAECLSILADAFEKSVSQAVVDQGRGLLARLKVQR